MYISRCLVSISEYDYGVDALINVSRIIRARIIRIYLYFKSFLDLASILEFFFQGSNSQDYLIYERFKIWFRSLECFESSKYGIDRGKFCLGVISEFFGELLFEVRDELRYSIIDGWLFFGCFPTFSSE